jgi:quercetin dioxygenase-like cupin family protein
MTIHVTPKHSFNYDSTTCAVFHANKGEGLPSHEHVYNHGTICLNGSIAIRKDGKEIIATKKNGAFDLLAGAPHEIEALEDNTVFMNIFATQFEKQVY